MTIQGPQVALFVDFENLVFGLRDKHGEAALPALIDAEALIRLARESGHLVLANAYADWRLRDFNQFQVDLYRSGMELVHVFGKTVGNRVKNAVDVKMAVDAIETVFMLPQVSVFVIVSGDRDFIHILKTLRRHGKTVVGVSPENAISGDFAGLCDRFLTYQALVNVDKPEPVAGVVKGLDRVRRALRDILSAHPEGLKGAAVKLALVRELGGAFDEGDHGFARMSDLLHAMPETVQVIPSQVGDLTVRLVGGPASGQGEPTPGVDPTGPLRYAANLAQYRFEGHRDRRRRILSACYREMAPAPFTLEAAMRRVLSAQDDPALSTTVLAKYSSCLWQTRAFRTEPDQEDLPHRERLMRLAPHIRDVDDFIFLYEASIAHKLVSASAKIRLALTPDHVATVLGLQADGDESTRAYCERLMTYSPYPGPPGSDSTNSSDRSGLDDED